MDLRSLPDEALTPAAVKRDRRRLETAFFWAAVLVAVLWLVKIAEWAAGAEFTALGLYPRAALGLIGLIGAPLVHGSVGHLMANSLPTLVLMTLAMYAVPRATFRALPLIWIGSGLLVWLFGRESTHIGISGVTHGLMSFLFVLGAIRRDRVAISIALVVFFLYGSMLYGFLPGEPGISFEYHGAGLLAGLVAALLYRRLDPAPPVRQYSWETEPEDLEGADGRLGVDPLEPERPSEVKPLWDGPRSAPRGVVLRFPSDRRRTALDDDDDARPPTLH